MPDSENLRELSIDMDASFHWSVGAHMERFIRGLGERKLMGVRCPGCKRVLVPPRKVCDSCFEETDEWVEAGPLGTVESFTIGYVEVDRGKGGLNSQAEPAVIALIRPDNADTAFVHRIRGIEPDEVESSMRVRPVYSEQPAGDLQDLKWFEPARGG